MASFVLTNAYALINSVNLSDHVKEVKVTYKADTPENTAMSQTTKNRLSGLKDWDLEITFNQDFAAANVDATLFPLIGAAAFSVEIRPDAGSRSATNPGYSGNCLLADLPIIAGKVGDVLSTSVKFVGTGTLSRLTA